MSLCRNNVGVRVIASLCLTGVGLDTGFGTGRINGYYAIVVAVTCGINDILIFAVLTVGTLVNSVALCGTGRSNGIALYEIVYAGSLCVVALIGDVTVITVVYGITGSNAGRSDNGLRIIVVACLYLFFSCNIASLSLTGVGLDTGFGTGCLITLENYAFVIVVAKSCNYLGLGLRTAGILTGEGLDACLGTGWSIGNYALSIVEYVLELLTVISAAGFADCGSVTGSLTA